MIAKTDVLRVWTRHENKNYDATHRFVTLRQERFIKNDHLVSFAIYIR